MGSQYYYKIVLLGDPGVGKTSLFNRIKTGKFYPSQATIAGTEGADQLTYNTKIDDDLLSVSLWDTAGGERFRTLTNTFYRDAHGAMLVYSVEDSYTFENLKDWIEDALSHLNQENFEWALIGNKNDLTNEVGKERVQARLQHLESKIFHPVSAKTGENVMKAFDNLISAIHKNSIKHATPASSARARNSSIMIDSATATTKTDRNSCCS